jgi:hypothetical protein
VFVSFARGGLCIDCVHWVLLIVLEIELCWCVSWMGRIGELDSGSDHAAGALLLVCILCLDNYTFFDR